MSLPSEERRALRDAWEFLLGLSSGEVSLERRTPVRQEARRIVRHFPLGGDPHALERAAVNRSKAADAVGDSLRARSG